MKSYFDSLGNFLQKISKRENTFLQNLNDKHSVSILMIKRLLDETTDSFYQNSLVIMNGSDIPELNIACLSVSYFNALLLNQKISSLEVPRITFIHLGMRPQEFNKKLFFFSFSESNNQNQAGLISNLQYISLYHSWEGEKSSEYSEYSWNHYNCIEIAMNLFLNQENKFSMEDILNDNLKCPKTIGSNEFIWLFDLVLKKIRYHSPKTIIFTYDFSLTGAHNHHYNLKPDILGYFTYMLSLISNQHVIFLANTNPENHIYLSLDKIQQQDYVSFDLFKSLSNYMTITETKQLLKSENFKQFKNLNLNDSTSGSEEEENKDEKNEVQIFFQKSVKGNDEKKNEEINILNQSNNFLNQSKKPIIEKNDINEMNHLENRFGTLSRMYSNESELIHSRNLFKLIQDQYYSVITGLLEHVNYLKVIMLKKQKSLNHANTKFQKSIQQQINQSLIEATNCLIFRSTSFYKYSNNLQLHTLISKISKIKQEKHIIGYVNNSNSEKIKVLSKMAIQQYKEDSYQSIIQNITQQKENQRSGPSKKLFTEALRVKIMIKKYTSSLLNNWIFDLRRKKKVFLNIKKNDETNYHFFFTERSQYIIDYEFNNLIIYFFNVQRGKLFKNFILIEEEQQNLFILSESKYAIKVLSDFLWKPVNQLSEIQKIKRKSQSQQQQEQQYFNVKQKRDKKIKIISFSQNIEELEIFNTALCMSKNNVYRFFGEIADPHKWKQKELSILVFSMNRILFNRDLNIQIQTDTSIRVLNVENKYKLISTIPRSGCSAIYFPQNSIDKEQICIFGGIGNNGFIYNVIEQYEIKKELNQEIIINSTKIPKQHSSQTLRPLFSPLSFRVGSIVYFIGGEFSKNISQRFFKDIFVQSIKFTGKKTSIQVEKIKLSDLNLNLKIEDSDLKYYQKFFLKHFQNFQFTTSNKNQGLFIQLINSEWVLSNDNQQDQKSTFMCSIIGKANTGVEQILEKTTVIKIRNLNDLFTNISQNFECETLLQKESSQSLRLVEYNNQNTFFISLFPVDKLQNEEQNFNIEEKKRNLESIRVTLPNYLMVLPKESNKFWILTPNQETKVMEKKFEFNCIFLDEDYSHITVSNMINFFSYKVNLKETGLEFYKTITFDEAAEITNSYLELEQFNKIYKSQIKFDQKVLRVLRLSELEIDLSYSNLFNRYIITDENHIYLINGAQFDQKDSGYYKIAPCERISLIFNSSEKISDCLFLKPRKCILLSNQKYIFYIGLISSCVIGERNESDFNSNKALIAQIFCKSGLQWTLIKISSHYSHDILTKFKKYDFQLGTSPCSVIAVKKRLNKNMKENINIILLEFNLEKKTAQLQQIQAQHECSEDEISICPSLFITNSILVSNSKSTSYVPTPIILPNKKLQ